MYITVFWFTDSYCYSWRCIKHDFIHHFHMPQCDLLVWIISCQPTIKSYSCQPWANYLQKLVDIMSYHCGKRGLNESGRNWKRTPIIHNINQMWKRWFASGLHLPIPCNKPLFDLWGPHSVWPQIIEFRRMQHQASWLHGKTTTLGYRQPSTATLARLTAIIYYLSQNDNSLNGLSK